MKTLKNMGVILLSVLVVGLSAGLLLNSNSSSGSSSARSGGVNTSKYDSAIAEFTEELELQQSAIEELQDRTYTQLYTHHFVVVLTLEQAFGNLSSTVAAYGGEDRVYIAFNVMSNSSTVYDKLSDMDGDGYIASAFGVYAVDDSPFALFDARVVSDGNIVLYVTNMSDGTVTTLVVPSMANYVVEDSVSAVKEVQL